MGKILPIGIENFEEITKQDFYYVDKSLLVQDLIESRSKVNLITRPRRFGKSLTMSMLKSFFEFSNPITPFKGLKLFNSSVFAQHQGKYPVISISLKDIDSNSFSGAISLLCGTFAEEFDRQYQKMRQLNLFERIDQNSYISLWNDLKEGEKGKSISDGVLFSALFQLCRYLYTAYNQQVVVLIDEYDVPLSKANANGYYDEIITVIRGVLQRLLKTNDFLFMGVLTGCLRIAHESIFTGLNNMRVFSVNNPYFDQYFGFTPDEVKQILDYYQLSNHYETLENWYDGYLFGRQHIFCPWDVISYVADLLNNPAIEPQNYWANSSSNEVVDHFIENGLSATVQDQLQRLVNGDSVQLTLRNDLTYQNMYQDSENLFSLLYSTGYLTSKEFSNSQTVNLVIPNVEIRQIFVESILNQAIKKAVGKSTMLNQLYHSFIDFQTDKACDLFQQYLQQTISVRDTFNRVRLKENFYHGLLLGMLSANNQWSVKSNQESGDGYADILVHTPTIGMVFEIKYAHTGDLELSCREGMEQILAKNYANYFNYEANQLYGRPLDKIYLYSIACYGKRCHIESKQLV